MKLSPEKVKSRAYYKANKARIRDRMLKKKFGIGTARYDEMLLAQESKCQICGSYNPGGRGSFHVDHSHATGQIRGLLCHSCNVGLGMFRDSPQLLHEAAKYITQ